MCDGADVTNAARQLWQVVEPIHAITYFEPECQQAFEDVGLRGFWRGYFAGRAAPLGAAQPASVVATFYGFHPGFVARALPSVWDIVTPTVALEARIIGVDNALRRLFRDPLHRKRISEAAALAKKSVKGLNGAGRPLFSANAALPWPTEPHLALWHATTLLREHRGDGHVMALVGAGLDPCEAHVTQVAASGTSLDEIKPYRGWSERDWASTRRRLRTRGLLDGRGRLTALGRQARADVEATTDRLASAPYERLGPEGSAKLHALLTPLAETIATEGLIPYPNPTGVPRPDAAH